MMNKENIWINKPCSFYWKDKIGNGGIFGKVMDKKTKKCLLLQTKSTQQGEPGCVYHGTPSPICGCLGKYQFTDMLKIAPNRWKCPHCQVKITGRKDEKGYLEYDYPECKGC